MMALVCKTNPRLEASTLWGIIVSIFLESSVISHAYLAQTKDLLSRIIAVHKELFGFSIRKIIPIPFIFKQIDHAFLWGEVKEVYHELNRLISNIKENPLTLARDNIFITYLEALADSANLFSVLLKRLSQKSSNINTYTKVEYLSDLEAYEVSQSKYSKLGVLLNQHLAKKI
jgi:hypothetical protein